ncbi:MAG: hypothetical protein RLZZ592_188 [Pseudomonadota bacterium]|jgi:energy-coupling factor transporter ATP-binding protein EcfA2
MSLSDAPTLQLTRLRVEQLRRFKAPFELRDLQPGLNLFTGANEAGKSTLVRAIRAAFFERHRSTAVDDLLPWGDSSAGPEVEIDFVLAGEPARLSKRFLQKKRCSLQIGAQRLEGVEAEDRLAQIFGFAFAGKGASKSEHWGIPGLLWIEQGTGHEVLDPARHARAHLHDALQGLIDVPGEGAGSVAALGSTDGDALLRRFTRERDELLTPTGRPRAGGPLGEAQAQAERLAAEIAALDRQIADYRDQVDQLERERAAQATDAAEAPQRALQADLQRARTEQQRLQCLGEQLARDRQQLAQIEAQRILQTELLRGTRQQADEAQRRRDAAVQAQARHQDADAARQAAELAQTLAQTQHAAADAALQRARRQERRQQLQQQRAAQQAECARLQAALQQAEQNRAHCHALQQQLDAVAITPVQLAALRQLDQQVRTAQLQCEALATRLEVDLRPGVTLTASDGTRLSGQGGRRVDAPLVLELPGLGTLRLTPGGDDLPRRQQALTEAQARRQQALQALKLADLTEAEARRLRAEALQTELKLAEQAFRLGAPQGLDALREALQRAEREGAQTEAALAAQTEPPAPADLIEPINPLDAATLTRLEQAEQSARRALERAQTELAQRRAVLATAAERLETAQREQAAAEALVADPQRLARLQAIEHELGRFDAEHQRLAGSVESQAAQLQAARPDMVAQDIVRLGRSLEQITAAVRERELRIARLESALQQAGAQGLEEQRAALAGEHLRAAARTAELERRAAALAWLCTRLAQQRTDALARLQAPLQQHLQHYLQLLFPQARLGLDEQLVPTTLMRPQAGSASGGLPVGDSGEFNALSFGAREQLGLIVRLAYADLLRSAGRPTLLILDDALVHSDAARLAQMKRVLFDAAQRHQVLLFTCHPELWRDLGVPARALEPLRGSVA